MRSEISSVKSGQMDLAKGSETFSIAGEPVNFSVVLLMAWTPPELTMTKTRRRNVLELTKMVSPW